MGTRIKVGTHAGIDSGTRIFSNCGYSDKYYSTLSIVIHSTLVFDCSQSINDMSLYLAEFLTNLFIIGSGYKSLGHALFRLV